MQNNIILSILIPTVEGRYDQWHSLITKIFSLSGLDRGCGQVVKTKDYCMNYWQSNCEVELISCYDNKVISIGEKRELLYKEATGKYSFMIDDDDDISEDAIDLILEAIKNNPDVDCVTFQEHCLLYGKYFKSNHSLSYPGWYGDGSHLLHDGFHYHRSPFYKDVIKTSIAQSVPFHHIRYGEDVLFSKDLYKHLKKEVHIDKEIYFYIYEPKDSHEDRYGIK